MLTSLGRRGARLQVDSCARRLARHERPALLAGLLAPYANERLDKGLHWRRLGRWIIVEIELLLRVRTDRLVFAQTAASV